MAQRAVYVLSIEPYDDEHYIEVHATLSSAKDAARALMDEDAEYEEDDRGAWGEDDYGKVDVRPYDLQ